MRLVRVFKFILLDRIRVQHFHFKFILNLKNFQSNQFLILIYKGNSYNFAYMIHLVDLVIAIKKLNQ